MEERISFLKDTAIFEDTPVAVLQKLAPLLGEVQVNQGSDVILKGEEGDSMFLIVEGYVNVHDGDHLFSTLKRHQEFGSYFLIDDIQRSATVTAEEPTRLLCMPRELFDDLVKNEPGFSRGLLRTLVRRLRGMNRIETQLAELNATKDKFFSIIAHDLRGPLSTIISFAGLLKDSRESLTDQQVSEIIRSQYDASWQSLKLLDNLLKWAQLQTGRLAPNPELVDLKELISDLVDFCTPSAKAKNISLRSINHNNCEGYADADMIRTVLLNLTNNAIKFTNRNGVVSINCEQSADHVLISVADNGVGIPGDRINTLFQLGKSKSTIGTEHEKGTGLGLILCKEFVEKNNGTIAVFSSPGVGSTFVITLPLRKAE